MSEQKIEAFWRDATAEDIAKVMRGEKVEARFRDPSAGWGDWVWCAFDNSTLFLGGWKAGEWFDHEGDDWTQCQVYDPQQRYIDKPDPGEGYRLLEKFPAEELQPGDDWWGIESKGWLPSRRACRGEQQDDDVWYRRRIEPKEVESRSKDYIPSGWAKLSDDEPRLASDAYWSQGAKDWIIIGDNRVEYANRDKWPAIRQRKFVLAQGESHRLPNGLTLKVYKEGFEVL